MASAIQALINDSKIANPEFLLPHKAQTQLDAMQVAPTNEIRSLLGECQHDPPCCNCVSCEVTSLRADVERLEAELDHNRKACIQDIDQWRASLDRMTESMESTASQLDALRKGDPNGLG